MKNIILLLVTLLVSLVAISQTNKSIISGNLPFLTNKDTVMVYVYKFGLFNHHPRSKSVYTTSVDSGKFKLSVPVGPDPTYVDVIIARKQKSRNLYRYLLEGSENIHLSLFGDKYRFSGKGGQRWWVINQMRQISEIFLANNRAISHMKTTKQLMEHLDGSIYAQLAILHAQESILGPVQTAILKGDLIGRSLVGKYAHLNYFGSIPDSLKLISQSVKDYRDTAQTSLQFDPDGPIQFSDAYTEGMLMKMRTDSGLFLHRRFPVREQYNFITRNYKGKLLERMLTFLLYDRRSMPEDLKPLITKALAIVKNEDFRAILRDLLEKRSMGAPAYPMNLTDVNGKRFDKRKLKGKVIVLDFWFTGCMACRDLAPEMKKIEQLFKKEQVVFVSISIDRNRDKWIKSVKSGLYASPEIVNLYTDGLGDNNPLIRYYDIKGYPTLILIDKNGKIAETPDDPMVDDGKDLIRLIKAHL